MAFDSRMFEVEIHGDQQRLWAVLEAVESTFLDVALEKGWTLSYKVEINHSTGEFHRDTVTAAKAVAERNGFEPTTVWIDVSARDSAAPDSWDKRWIDIHASDPMSRLPVRVRHGSEVDVNGVYTVLKEAADAIPMPPPDPDPVYVPVAAPPAEPQPRWKQILHNAWLVGIGVTVIGTVLGTLLVLWLT